MPLSRLADEVVNMAPDDSRADIAENLHSQTIREMFGEGPSIEALVWAGDL